MVRESPIHFSEEQMVFARKILRQEFKGGAGGPITRVPTDPQRGEDSAVDSGQPFEHPGDIGCQDFAPFMGPLPFGPVASSSHPAELLDIVAKERAAKKYHLEAIVIGGIVAASYLNAALHILG